MSEHTPDGKSVARPEVSVSLLDSVRDRLSEHFDFPVSYRVTVEHALKLLNRKLGGDA